VQQQQPMQPAQAASQQFTPENYIAMQQQMMAMMMGQQ